MGRVRAFGAGACLAAIALALLLVPRLHALVHIHEAERGEHHAHGVADHHDDNEPAPRHHHHGGRDHAPGESPLEHGRGAPEHLGLALIESDLPPIPPAGPPVDSLVPPAPIDRLAAAPSPKP